MTFSVPDTIAKKFCSKVPSRTRSRLITKWIVKEIETEDALLEKACILANADEALQEEINQWQLLQEPIIE